MAVSGVTGGGTSIYGSRNVLSGLASGMDTESMIENMTQATRVKIAQQKQKKTLLGWKQSAYQGISTQLIDFSKKYMDYQSPTNLLSPSFFDQTIVTPVGKNSGAVSASGKTNSDVKVNGVKQLASSATHMGIGDQLTSPGVETGVIGMNEDVTIHNLAGESLTFKYGNKRYTVSLTQGADLSTMDKVAEEINKKLGETEIAGGHKLSEKLKVTVKDDPTGKKSLVFTNTDSAGNKMELVGAGANMQGVLGVDFEKVDEAITLSKDKPYEGALIEEKDLTHKEKMSDFLVGKSLNFSLNGRTQNITLMTEEDKTKMAAMSDPDAKNKYFQEQLQKRLDDAFGTGKINVDFTTSNGKGKLQFKTQDENDIMRVEGGSSALFGKTGAFGIEAGDGNRLNMNRSLEKLGVKFTNGDRQTLVINGTKVGEYGKDATISDILRDINKNDSLGITAKYSELTNTFELKTKDTGSHTKIEIGGDLGEVIFGKAGVGKVKNEVGKDAVVDVTIDGERRTLTRATNEIEMNGLKVTVSDTFGDYSTGTLKLDAAEEVSFTSKPDTEKVFDAIKEMVEDYNNLVESVYKELTTKPDREYKPLTDEQKKEMTKEQIEQWEEKAKEGQLFMDSQLRSLHDSLSVIFSPADKELNMALKSMGIEPTKDHKDGGKIKLDETKLKEVLASNPEKVKNAFNASALSSESGHGSEYRGGALTQLKAVTNQFASTSISTPGSLVALAGSPKSPNSILNNTLQKEMEGIDKVLDNLDRKLKKEIDRYNSKFTQLEMLISQMNAQSGQLAGLMGGGM